MSPPVLAFFAGATAALLRGGLRLPLKLYTALSASLLFAIGVKGGLALAGTTPADIWRPALATGALGIVTPILAYGIMRRFGKFGVADSAAVAAHYGSVSIVTFTAALGFLTAMSVGFEGYMPTLVALLEIPAIVVALLIARWRSGEGENWRAALREVATGRSVVLLAGGMTAGLVVGRASGVHVAPSWFKTGFAVALVIFLLEMGMAAAGRLREFRGVGGFLACFAILMPLAMGVAGVFLGRAAGLSLGGSTILATMAASASYIAAPAAVRIALPEANPAYYLTTAIGITFPFNLVVGVPVYYTLAGWVA